MADHSAIKDALDEAQVLHALYLGAQADAEKASDKGSKERARLKDKYGVDLLKVDEAENKAQEAVADARETLERHQRKMQDELGASIDLLQVRPGASVSL